VGFAQHHLIPLVDEGLGNSAYLVDLGDGRALAVDASRDLRTLRRAAERRGLPVAFAADTHLHADFLTGACRLAAEDGAQILASAAGNRTYPHRGLGDGDEVDLGGLTLRALATPGHTLEHVSYLLLDGTTPVGVFTGGSLIVGAAARTDLVDPARTRGLAYAQYASLRRLAELPDGTAVWPTHGAGSFCSAPPGAARVTTIGEQKAVNRLLAAPDADTFADLMIASLGSYPPYFARLAEINRTGPTPLADVLGLPRLDAGRARRVLADGALAVDVRPVSQFAAGHVPGSLSIALRPGFASWLGWLTDPDATWIAIHGSDQDLAEIAWQAVKIGHRLPAGYLCWDAWDGPLANLPLLSAEQIAGRTVVDVRQDGEFVAGHLPDARHIELGALTADPTTELDPLARLGLGVGDSCVVMCAHGQRAATGASLLLRAGAADVAVLDGGPRDWATATGRSLKEGP
jgi:hydroxyacylglutathione hydrolase